MDHYNLLKNQRISGKLTVMRRFWFLLFLPLFLLVACSGELAGTIFLDDNANNLLDPTEKGISKAVFLVRKDGILITSGVSDAQGKYSIKIKENGYYCVEVDKSVERQGVAVWTAKSLGIKGVDEDSVTEEEEEKKPEEEEKSKTETEDERETHQPGIVTYDIRKTCSEVNSTHGTLSVAVPKQFKPNQLPADAEHSISLGEVVELQFFCPVSCTRLPLYLPRELEVASRSRFYDASVNRLQFSESRRAARAVIPATSVIEDPLVIEKVPVRLKEGVAVADNQTISLKLQCQCPDGTVVASNAVNLKVGAADPVDVRQSVTRDEENLRQREIEVSVENLAGGTYRRVELVMELPHLPNMDAALIGGNIGADACSNLEIKFLCHLDLAPGETKNISYRFTLPEVAILTTYTAKAKVTLRENNQTIEAEDVVIPLGPKPVDE